MGEKVNLRGVLFFHCTQEICTARYPWFLAALKPELTWFAMATDNAIPPPQVLGSRRSRQWKNWRQWGEPAQKICHLWTSNNAYHKVGDYCCMSKIQFLQAFWEVEPGSPAGRNKVSGRGFCRGWKDHHSFLPVRQSSVEIVTEATSLAVDLWIFTMDYWIAR